MNWEQDDIFLSKWLNGELSEEERLAFEATEEGQDLLHLMKASTLIEPPGYNVNAELSKLQDRMQGGSRKKQKSIWMQTGFQLAAAASVILVLALVFLFDFGTQTIETAYGEQEIVQLPDGSELELNSASLIAYDPRDWENSRTVDLEGEAFFRVKKGTRFNVKTNNGSVEVLGTSFNVKSRDEILTVTCYEGQVEIAAKNITKALQSGERVIVAGQEITEFKSLKLSPKPSWTKGITELENAALPQVLDELGYVFGCTVEYDGSLDQIVYTGAFPNANSEAAFKLVFEPLNIDYSYDLSTKKLKILGLKQ